MNVPHDPDEGLELRPEADASDQVVNLGPFMVFIHGRAIGLCDTISATVADATAEELEELRTASEIRLVKPRGFRIEARAPGDQQKR